MKDKDLNTLLGFHIEDLKDKIRELEKHDDKTGVVAFSIRYWQGIIDRLTIRINDKSA